MTLLQSWQKTALVFAIQAALAILLRATFVHDWYAAVLLVGFGSVLLLLPAIWQQYAFFELLVATGAVFFLFDGWIYDLLNKLTGVLVVASIVWRGANDPTPESLGLRVLVRIPLGVGAALGGLVLLHRAHWLLGRFSRRTYAVAITALSLGALVCAALVDHDLGAHELLGVCFGLMATAVLAVVHCLLSDFHANRPPRSA